MHSLPKPAAVSAAPASAPIVVAVEHPVLHPEALHIAAACGRPVLEVADRAQLKRLAPRAFAILHDVPWPALEPSADPPPNAFVLTAEPDSSLPGAFVLPAQAADLLRALGALATRTVPAPAERGRTIAVVGAAGGVGVSVMAASISKKAPSCTLIDAHRRSGGLDLLLGIEEEPGARWGEISFGDGRVAREDVRRALPQADGVAVLTFARTTVADTLAVGPADVEAVAAAVGTAGVTVLDCPPEYVPAQCDLAVVVLPAQLRAVAAAARTVADLASRGVSVGLLLRDSPWNSLDATEIERIAGARVIGSLRTVRGLTKAIERGGMPSRLPRALSQAADAVLAELDGLGDVGAVA